MFGKYTSFIKHYISTEIIVYVIIFNIDSQIGLCGFPNEWTRMFVEQNYWTCIFNSMGEIMLQGLGLF